MTHLFSRGCALAAALLLGACAGQGDPVDIDVTLPAPSQQTAYQAERGNQIAATNDPAAAAVVLNESVARGNAKPIHLRIHTHNQQWPSWMLDTDKLALDYIVNLDVVPANYPDAVATAERACRIYVHDERPNEAVAVLMNGTLFAVSEFPFATAGASVFRGAKIIKYGANAAADEMGGGVGDGVMMLGNKLYDFQGCGQGIFTAAPDYPVVVLGKSPY